MTTVIESHYLPSISFFSAISTSSVVCVEKFEHYQKQTYRNRCYINTSQGEAMLTVPVTGKHGNTIITDIKIDHNQKWVNNHWRAIRSAYGKAPFFEYYADDLEKILFQKQDFLYDLNLQLLTMCLKWLKWKIEVKETTEYQKTLSADRIDLRSKIISRQPDGSNNYYEPNPYQQVFGSKFVEDLSLIDLIFCEGPGAGSIIKASASK